MLREQIQVKLQIPDAFSAIAQESHRLIRMNSLGLQKFKDPSFRFTVSLVDKRHTLRLSLSCQDLAQTTHHYTITKKRRKPALEQARQRMQRVKVHAD
jgi:hypothetical protein